MYCMNSVCIVWLNASRVSPILVMQYTVHLKGEPSAQRLVPCYARAGHRHIYVSSRVMQITLFFAFIRCALSDEGASRLTDVHDNSEEVIIQSKSFIKFYQFTTANMQLLLALMYQNRHCFLIHNISTGYGGVKAIPIEKGRRKT